MSDANRRPPYTESMREHQLLPGVTVSVLCDACVLFPEPTEQVFPGGGVSGLWPLHVHCYLLRLRTLGAERLILVDTGLGEPWAPGFRWLAAPSSVQPSGLLAELAALGVVPADVTDVVLTHLHLDHVGWNVHGVPPTPTFPNARYIVQAVETENLRGGGPADRDLYDSHVEPLAAAGQLDRADGPCIVAPNVRLHPAPGHTAGHQVVVVDASVGTVTMSGDAFVHPVQAADPSIAYRFEADPAIAASTRRQLLRSGGLLAPAHWVATLSQVSHDDDGVPQLADLFRCERQMALPQTTDSVATRSGG